MKIFKYPFTVADIVKLEMPSGAQILDIQVQNGQPCLWARVDENNMLATYTIYIFGTGHDCDYVGEYISTFQMRGGALVWHAFLVE